MTKAMACQLQRDKDLCNTHLINSHLIQHGEDLCNTLLTLVTFKSESQGKISQRKLIPGDQTQDFRLGDEPEGAEPPQQPHFLNFSSYVPSYCLEI